MRFEIEDISDEGVAVSVPLTATWLAEQCPDLGVTPDGMKLVGRLQKMGDAYLLTGKLAGAVMATCTRCLEPAHVALSVDVSVSYEESGKIVEEEAEAENNLFAPDILPIEDGVIDLGSELRDELILNLPQSLLCREDCLGLCPVCGGNRNVTACACVEQERMASSKFAALSKLKS